MFKETEWEYWNNFGGGGGNESVENDQQKKNFDYNWLKLTCKINSLEWKSLIKWNQRYT